MRLFTDLSDEERPLVIEELVEDVATLLQKLMRPLVNRTQNDNSIEKYVTHNRVRFLITARVWAVREDSATQVGLAFTIFAQAHILDLALTTDFRLRLEGDGWAEFMFNAELSEIVCFNDRIL